MTEPAPPILAWEDNDLLSVYSSVRAFCSYVEWIDVLDGVYEVFDSAGRTLVPIVSGYLVFGVSVDESKPADTELMTRRVRSYLELVGPELYGFADVAGASLGDMLAAMSDRP